MSLTWSGPSRALQYHLDLYDRVKSVRDWLESHQNVPIHTSIMPPQLSQRMRLMTASTGVEGDSTAFHRDNFTRAFDQENVDRTWQVLSAEYKALNEGETHYMSMGVMKSIQLAAETMEPEKLFETDLPCPQGLIVFEYPMVHNDLHPDTGEVVTGLLMPVRAISWTTSGVRLPDGTSTEGVCYCLYTDTESFQKFYITSFLDHFGPEDGMDDLIQTSETLRTWMTDTSGWGFGVQWDDERYGELVATTRRFLLAYWRWTWQRILVPTPYVPSRAERKWGVRVKRPLEDGMVKILRLRREIEHEKQKGEYVGIFDYQFMVRGHWRRQHYPKLGPAKINGEFNHESHRLVWIEPHLKGNPTGPLVLGHNVTVAVR